MPVLPPVIPLFPLPGVVLFPQMPMPLHVFEPRYRKMVEDVMKDHRTIGMVLLRPGWESTYYGRPPVYPTGCAGLVGQCEPLEGGRYNIVLRGVARFQVRDEHGGEPYRLAEVEYRGDQMGDAAELEARRSQLLTVLGKSAEGILMARPDLPHDVLVNALCQSLSLAPVEKQSLLECETILARYSRLLEILEFRLLEQTYGPGGEPTVH